VNWTIVGHAIQNLPGERFNQVQHGCGIYAPAIRFHDGKFWIYFPMPDEGIYVTTATDPAGHWSKPKLVQAGKGLIDPCPFWDDDGRAYLVHAWAKSRSGTNSILTLHRMSPDGLKLLDDGLTVFDGHPHHPIIEGPKLHKRNGYYYIFAPAGGVPTGWQTILRSTNIFGPYQDKIVLAQGKTGINGPHQGAWVDTTAGEDWFIHFQDRGAYGRILHLEPMKWVNDWPVMGVNIDSDGKGEPATIFKKPAVGKKFPVTAPQTSDEFALHLLGQQWQWQANASQNWYSLAARPGWLRLNSMPLPDLATNYLLVPNLLLQKFPAPEFTVTTKLEFPRLRVGEKAGLIVMGLDYAYLSVKHTTDGYSISQSACYDATNGSPEIIAEEIPCTVPIIFLRVKVDQKASCEFSYSLDGEKFAPIGKPFVARVGKWIGAKVGLFSVSPNNAKNIGYADFDWFKFKGNDSVADMAPHIFGRSANN
jgi:beta-xylosidase